MTSGHCPDIFFPINHQSTGVAFQSQFYILVRVERESVECNFIYVPSLFTTDIAPLFVLICIFQPIVTSCKWLL